MGFTPRILIAGLGGDSGKTFLSCGLLRLFRRRNLKPAAFKKGPDYIDSAWLKAASGVESRNLDGFLMSEETIKRAFIKGSKNKDIALIEGNRGLYDGLDARGSYSSAESAKILKAPTILVISPRKVTRTVAAFVLGCKKLDEEVNLSGVVLTQVSGKRHAKVVSEAIENDAGVPVLGAIPKIKNEAVLPSRHLGLVTPVEHDFALKAIETASEMVERYVDVDKILEIGKSAGELEPVAMTEESEELGGAKVKIGYFFDRAFSFYYPENLEALESLGAELVKVSSLDSERLPDLDALYIGGGFPETNLEALVRNKSLMKSVKRAADGGLPIYAECGGLIFLGESLFYKDKEFELSGVLPIKTKMNAKPAGHGYSVAEADIDNGFYPNGAEIKGHEFHYTEIVEYDENLKTVLKMKRGSGAVNGRDGILSGNVFASYVHVHASGQKNWASGLVGKAREYSKRK